MTREELLARLLARLPALEESKVPVKGYLTMRLKSAEALLPTARALRDEFGFDYLEIVSGTDWLGPVKSEGYIGNPNPNVFLPEGAAPQDLPGATAGVDYRPVFDLLWVFGNIAEKSKLFVRLEVPRDNPRVASLTPIFKAADWQEREMFDLMGVVYEGHPNLSKILTPDFIQGHPLRKDYVHIKDQYDE